MYTFVDTADNIEGVDRRCISRPDLPGVHNSETYLSPLLQSKECLYLQRHTSHVVLIPNVFRIQ